jgi:hypothetical protein
MTDLQFDENEYFVFSQGLEIDEALRALLNRKSLYRLCPIATNYILEQ